MIGLKVHNMGAEALKDRKCFREVGGSKIGISQAEGFVPDSVFLLYKQTGKHR